MPSTCITSSTAVSTVTMPTVTQISTRDTMREP